MNDLLKWGLLIGGAYYFREDIKKFFKGKGLDNNQSNGTPQQPSSPISPAIPPDLQPSNPVNNSDMDDVNANNPERYQALPNDINNETVVERPDRQTSDYQRLSGNKSNVI